MENCLLTKLKSTVNAELPIFNGVTINVKASTGSTDRMRQFSVNVNGYVTIDSNHKLYVEGSEITLPYTFSSRKSFVAENEDARITIIGKGTITEVATPSNSTDNSTCLTVNLDEFTYCNALTVLKSKMCCNGSIDALKMSSGLTTLYVAHGQCTGNFTTLMSFPLLTEVAIANTHITGNIEDFVNVLNARGFSAGTYGGVKYTNTLKFCGKTLNNFTTMAWIRYSGNTNKIAVNIGNSDSNTSYIYVYGYTQSEIDELKSQGFVTIVDAETRQIL